MHIKMIFSSSYTFHNSFYIWSSSTEAVIQKKKRKENSQA